jgi:glycosyltransferase involved in cell wall biosynthesis
MSLKQILFLTTTNLAANPRLTKELRLAKVCGFKATVIQFTLGNWSDAKTEELKKEFTDVHFVHISALRKPFVPWLISSLLERFGRILPLQKTNVFWLSMAVSKRTYLLLKQIEKIKNSFTWVIAHNPGAFYPAQVAAKKTGARLGIDVEDYHPGESTNQRAGVRMKGFMQRVLPNAAYCSFAAPLIRERFLHEMAKLPESQMVILNGFEQSDFLIPEDLQQQPLKCVWFSQFIDKGRGLEYVLPVIGSLYPQVELHLVGHLKESFRDEFIKENKGVVLHASMKQIELHHFLSKFDVGLAIEPGRDINNQLAVSNKIMAFAQAGLFILASHTNAQDQFLAESQLEYIQTNLKPDQIQETLVTLIRQKEQIRLNRLQRFQNGRAYDWERLSSQLVDQWVKK